jgi:hypothetical protein
MALVLPTLRFTIGRVMMAIVVVALYFSSFHDVLLTLAWIFVVGPLCGCWPLRRKGDWMILGGGAGGAAAGFLFALGGYLGAYDKPNGFEIWTIFCVSVAVSIPGLFFGVCTRAAMLLLPGLRAPLALSVAASPMIVTKRNELSPTSRPRQSL